MPTSYVALWKNGELHDRVIAAGSILDSCTLCPRECRVDRNKGRTGFCRTGMLPVVSGYGPHFGEEKPLVGRNGSGTIFFSGCTMSCIFCQNYTTSQGMKGRPVTHEELAGIMIRLRDMGCHNINLVSPTHVVPSILSALEIAAGKGLDIPLVYNTGTYDSVRTLKLLNGIVDIYMPDAKYGSDTIARDLSGVDGYTGVMKNAICEMYRQVGDLTCGDGIAMKGLLVRHLVLPGNLAGSAEVMEFIAHRISQKSYVNIMDQYHPAWKAAGTDLLHSYHDLGRPVTGREFGQALGYARKIGLYRGFDTGGSCKS